MKLYLCFLSLLLVQTLQAQWEQLPMPKGGDVQFLVTANNRVWVNCSSRNYFSDDQGMSWQQWALQDTLDFINLYIANDGLMAVAEKRTLNIEETIFKSVDNGDTWQAIYSDTLHQYDIGNAFSAGGYLFFLDVDYGFGSHLYRSSNQGKTWENINVIENNNGDHQLFSVRVGNDVLVAGIDIVDGIGDPHSYQVKSTDFGQTWSNFNLPFFSGAYSVSVMENCWVVKRSYNSDAVPIYVSFDSGLTFTYTPIDHCKYRLFFAPPNKLYSFDNDCLAKLNLLSNAWEPLNTPPISFFNFIQTENGTLLVGAHGKEGVWRTPNEFTEWSEANDGLPSSGVNKLAFHNDHFFLSNETGVHRSTDNCQSWQDKSPPADIYDLQFWGDTLLAASSEKIYYSVDEGKNWALLFQTYPIFDKIKTAGDTMFCAVQDWVHHKILYTKDRGASSNLLALPQTNTGAKLADYLVFQGKIWVVMDSGKVFYSENNGQSWVESLLLSDFRLIFNQNEHFFLNGAQCLFSPDAGGSWFPAFGIPAGKLISSIKNDQNNRWYAALEDGRLFVSDDYGVNWSFWDNPGNPKVTTLYPIGDQIYVKRNSAGLWRRSLVSSQTNTPVENAYSTLSVIPNPAQTEIEIIWPPDTAPETPVVVYDVYGRLLLQTKVAQETILKLDLSTWPRGFYFVNIGRHSAKLIAN